MDLLDRLALWGRKYERQTAGASGRTRFNLWDLLSAFDRQAILEMTLYKDGKPIRSIRPDTNRKMKVSLLDDGVSAIDAQADGWFEVFKTAPSGDTARVRVLAFSADGTQTGELRMLVGARSFEQYFEEDPIFDAITRSEG